MHGVVEHQTQDVLVDRTDASTTSVLEINDAEGRQRPEGFAHYCARHAELSRKCGLRGDWIASSESFLSNAVVHRAYRAVDQAAV